MQRHLRMASGCALGGFLALLAGCSIAPPKPWEKDILARPVMSMDNDTLGQRFLQQIYTSKENSSGGDGVGGGSCGCN